MFHSSDLDPRPPMSSPAMSAPLYILARDDVVQAVLERIRSKYNWVGTGLWAMVHCSRNARGILWQHCTTAACWSVGRPCNNCCNTAYGELRIL